MIIAMCCTKNWYIYQLTNIYALFKHNKVKKLYLFIEDDNIPYLQDDRIEFINVNNLPEYITKESPNYNTKYTKISYLRCYFTKVLKCDKIIYIDADAIVTKNIEDLWNIDLEDNVIAGVHEQGEWNKHLWTYGLDDTYINSGVLLMDLKKLKEEKLDDSMIYLLNHKKFAFPDQDVINLVCRNRIKQLSNIYNSTETTGFRDDAKVVHYIRGNKGWKEESPRSEIWFKYHYEMIGGRKMDQYHVKAIKNFTDYLGKETKPENEHIERKANQSDWYCDGERYKYLKEHKAVELIEIIPAPKEETEDKVEEPKEVKPKRKPAKKKK